MTRVLSTALRNSLLTEEEFAYAHLIKFEKPLKTVAGKSARRAKDYTYLSDGSFDLVFNDGSSDIEGNANGAQTYIANKVLKVGATSETTEARASSITLTVSAAALSTSFTDNITTTGTSITTASTDFVEAGFREGDVIQLTSGSGANNTAKARINSFSNSNKTANVTPLTKVSGTSEVALLALTAHSATSYSISFASAEVESILSNRSSNTYARYINRDVFIYKAHIDKDTGAIIGNPYLLFKGIIASGKISEDPAKQSVVTWSITSHWGDFQRVSGRITSDSYHRALDGNGIPDKDALVRPAYGTDYGFLHSESAVNLMAVYQVQETRYKEKRRGGLAGLFGGKKLKEYQVEVDREVDLRFNLDAKYLPVVYGVNKIDSIPVFADSLNSTAKKVYVAYALCEGEIGGIYDIYFDDTNSVCLDANDSSTRSSQTDNSTVDVLCSGRMDRGDTLRPNAVTTGSTLQNGYPGGAGRGNWSSLDEAEIEAYYIQQSIGNPNVSFGGGTNTSGAGITHEKGHGFTTPIDTRLIFHAGKPDQKADSLLVSQASNFKVGTDYYSGSTAYWGASHRLLDTAYVVAEYTISEGETQIPSLDFVVRGKGVECYNYDFSFEQDPDYTSSDASASAFNLGDTVALTATSGGASLGNATIADIYTLTNIDGTTGTRIRFLSEPPLNYNSTTGFPAVTAFVMTKGSNSYHLVTHNHTIVSGTVAKRLEETISSVANNSSTGVDLTVTNADAAMQQAIDFAELLGIYGGEIATADQRYVASLLNQYTFTPNSSAKKLEGVGQTTTGSSTLVNKKAVLKDVVALDSNASSTDDVYNGRFIEVTHVYTDNTVKIQKRKIIDYDGGTKVAKVDTQFEEDALPKASDTYKIFSVSNDVRVSTNPAMQLLDYLTAKRYGRDLDLEDLDLPSFLQSARDCDTRSDVTVVTTAAATADDVYTLTDDNNKVIWVGTVKSSTQIESGRFNTVFTDVSGKLAHRWENWKYFFAGEYYYYEGALHEASSNGIITSTPSTTASVSSFSITRSSGSGPSSLSLEVTKATSTESGLGNPVVKIGIAGSGPSSPGYSLYDADDVKYWRYMGWESQNQRQVTRHQTNAVINTANSVFDNVNSMLGHFNGILRYSNGKYSLGVKKASTTPSTVTIDGVSYTLGDVSDEDIIGQINVEDAGQKGTYNQVSVTVNDPQNRFEGRSVNLFNSDYLKEDRMVPKKGTSTSPFITNYYNARLNAKQYLDESRAGLKVSFTMGPKGLLLRAGDIIRITYSRFGWTNKLYRVKNLNFQDNCLVQVTAEEHNDDGYLIQPRQTNVVTSADVVLANIAAPAAPTDSPTLSATQNDRGGIVLNWTNTSTFNPATYTVNIFRHTSNNRSGAKIVGTSKGDNFTDTITGTGSQTFYYWIRYSVNVPLQRTTGVAPREVFSDFFPSSATGGVVGISDGARDAISINLTNDNVSIPANSAGTPANFNNTSVSITAFIGNTALNYDDSAPYAAPSFRVSGVTVSSGITAGSEGSTSTSYTRQNITGMTQDTGSIVYTIVVTDSLGQTTTFGKTQTFTKVKDGLVGSNGEAGRVVTLTASDQTIEYNSAGASPSPSSITITANAFNTSGTVFYEFLKGNSSVQNTTGNTYTYTPQASASNMPETVSVKIREGSNSSTVLATDQINIAGLQPGRDAITIILSNEAHTVPAANNGTVSTFAGSGTDIQVFQGTTQLTYDDSSPYANSTFRIATSGSSITAGSATTISGNTRRFGNATNMTANAANITFTITVKGSDGAETVFTRVQSFSKSLEGAAGQSITGPTGPRTASAVLYYQTSSSSAPSAPTASSYNFSTGLFGSHTSGWAEEAPTFAAGNANKYWYVRITVAEATFGGTQNISIGNVIQGIGFSGLVTFTGNQAVGDGNQSLSFGAQGTTTIDGGRITTGTIDAQRLNVGQINVTQTANYSTIQQNITGAAQQGITAAQQAAGQAVQAQQGVTAAQQAAQSAAGQAVQAQQGVVVAQQAAAAAVQTLPDQLSDLQNDIGAFTQPAQINVTQTNNYVAPPTQTSQLQNNSGFQTSAFTSSGQVNITQTQNYAAPPTATSQLQNDSGFFNQPGQLNITQLSNYGQVTQAIAQAAAQGVAGQQAASAAAQQATQAQQGVSTAQTAAAQAAAQGVAGQQAAGQAAAQAVAAQQGVSTAQTAAAQAAGQAVAAQQAIPTQTSQLSNNSGFQTAAITFSATAISGGKIGLSTQGLIIGNGQVSVSANNAILLDTTQGNNAISIFSGTTLRVKIGKL